MCETLDEIHNVQLAAVIAKLRRQKIQAEKPLAVATWFLLYYIVLNTTTTYT